MDGWRDLLGALAFRAHRASTMLLLLYFVVLGVPVVLFARHQSGPVQVVAWSVYGLAMGTGGSVWARSRLDPKR